MTGNLAPPPPRPQSGGEIPDTHSIA